MGVHYQGGEDFCRVDHSAVSAVHPERSVAVVGFRVYTGLKS